MSKPLKFSLPLLSEVAVYCFLVVLLVSLNIAPFKEASFSSVFKSSLVEVASNSKVY